MTQRSFYGGRIKVGGSGGRTRGDFVSNEQLRHILMGVRQRLGRWQHEEASGEAAPPPVWQTFPTQQPAFDLADSQPGLDVFSGESCRCNHGCVRGAMPAGARAC